MKNLKFLTLAIAILGFTATSFAQTVVSAPATSSATIVTPIKITKEVDLNFGNIAVNNQLGTVVLTPAGSRTATGGVTLPTTAAGTVTAAKFTVTGSPEYTYSISHPTELNISYGTNTMVVDGINTTPTKATGGVLTAEGTQDILVGATLNVAANQTAGVYTNTDDLKITVNYN